MTSSWPEFKRAARTRWEARRVALRLAGPFALRFKRAATTREATLSVGGPACRSARLGVQAGGDDEV
jgi:hypothetical protein